MLKKLALLFLLPSLFAFTDPIDLTRYDKSCLSDHGEDGVVQRVFQLIPTTSRLCLELGANDGTTGNVSPLLRKLKWDSVVIDRKLALPDLSVYKEFITKENINSLLLKYAVPFDLDILVINTGYNCFHFWNAIDARYNPALVIIKYNASLSAQDDKVVEYRPYFCGNNSNYFGASILALYKLGRAKGYSLIYADKTGSMLFFLRDDLIYEHNLLFKDMNDVERLYRMPTYGEGPDGGYKQDKKNRAYFPSSDFLTK